MILGRLVDTAENGGRQIMLNGQEVSIEGLGAATFSEIAEADARGEVAWAESAFRTWVVKRATEAGWVVGRGAAAPEPQPEPVVASAPEPEAEPVLTWPVPEPVVRAAPAREPAPAAVEPEPASDDPLTAVPERARKGKQMLSTNARIVLGVVGTLLIAAIVAVALGRTTAPVPVPAEIHVEAPASGQ